MEMIKVQIHRGYGYQPERKSCEMFLRQGEYVVCCTYSKEAKVTEVE